jgi:hypothetical protein
MTPTKVLSRLVVFAPPILARFTKMPQHCVLATAVACDVLRECGMSAEPLSVRAIVANRRFVEGHREGLAAATIVATGGHILDTRTDGTVTNKMWNGHLVAWIRDRACLVDLTLGAFNRPRQAIALPPAYVFAFHPPSTDCEFRNGVHVEYVAKPDDRTWIESADYRRVERRRELVALVARAVRCGHL